MQEEFEFELSWCGFELHPETPVGGIEVVRLFPGATIAKMRAHMSRFAAEFGVEMVVPEHLSNTRRALAMAQYAQDQGRLPAFRDAASFGYWTRGLDLESDEDLGAIAAQAGLDVDAALGASSSEEYLLRVRETRVQGMSEMVTGVPTLFVAGMPVVGCQRYETFERVFERAGLPRRS